MNPSLRRCISLVALIGASVSTGPAAAQQAGAASAPAQSAAAQPKQAPPKSETPNRKPVAKAAPKPKLDPAAAQGEVENGVNALAQGRADAAVTSLTSALNAGSLPQAQTARALYYRGVAHRRQAKPAQAISDLTSALWIKGGLTEEQRADAVQQRSAAYREAGLSDQSDPAAMKQIAAAKPGSSATPFGSVAPPAPVSSTSLGGSAGGFFSSLFGGSSAEPQQQAAPARPAAPPTTTASVAPRPAQPSSAQSVTAPVTSANAAQAPAAGTLAANPNKPATRLVPVYSEVSAGPNGFQDITPPVRHVEVSTTARAAPPANVAAPAGAGATAARPVEEPKVKSAPAAAAAQRAQAGEKAAGQPALPKVQAVAAAKPAANAEPAASGAQSGRAAGGLVAPPATGKVRIQVAAVRSAEEANGVTSKLQSQFAGDLGGRAPVVDQVSAGNFGTFYRVQVGPFASTRETEGLCAKLKSGGLDCRVVSQ